ncbi:MAG: amidohydrolase family protein [Acidobacteria bacterium]|nr:amidohydrolase family protein [Acidobacteriota bacterium]
MIIDAHTHIFPEWVAEKAISTVIANMKGRLKAFTDGTLGGLLASMDNAGVDLSIILPVATTPGQGDGILQWIKASPSSPRIIYFGSVHPEDPGYRDQIRGMAEFGLQGLKFHPAYQNFPVNSKEACAVYEEALKYDMVMYFHAGYDPSMPGCDYASVKRYAVLAKDFHGSKMVLAHGGGYREWNRVLDLLGNKGCYFDVAFVLGSMRRDKEALELYRQNEDYFIFGTDSPWRDQKRYVELIRDSDTLTPEQKEKLLYKNVQKLVKF